MLLLLWILQHQPLSHQASAAGEHEVKTEEEAGDDELSPEELELATFKIDGTCPRCGRVITKAHAKHLANCSGRERKTNTISIAELVQLEVEKIEKEEKKLQELELGGLIDLTDDAATFMVVGSKGVHCHHATPPCTYATFSVHGVALRVMHHCRST